MPLRSPDNVAPCALRIHRRRPDKSRRRCRRSVRQTRNRSPSSALQLHISWRSCDPARCNAPSFSHPAHAGIRSRNVRKQPCSHYMRQYSLIFFVWHNLSPVALSVTSVLHGRGFQRSYRTTRSRRMDKRRFYGASLLGLRNPNSSSDYAPLIGLPVSANCFSRSSCSRSMASTAGAIFSKPP
jgi:hypothetical protein